MKTTVQPGVGCSSGFVLFSLDNLTAEGTAKIKPKSKTAAPPTVLAKARSIPGLTSDGLAVPSGSM